MLKKLSASVSALLLMLLPLAGTVRVAALTTNPIANPSVEAGGTAPTGWTSSSWTDTTADGDGFTPTFEYVTNDGHNDSHSLKVSISGYSRTYVPGADDGTMGGALTGDNGDAKWIFDPINVSAGDATATAPLQVGHQYRFTAWYKSNVIPKVVVDYMNASGTESFYGMSNPEASPSAWTQYSNTFSIPQGTTQVTVFMFLDQNGWLQTDDYSLSDYTPTGWDQPLLTLTFDDGHEDNVTNALPLLNQYDFKTTQCFETGTIQADPVQSQNNVLAFYNAGHEICSHTVTHPMLTQLNDTQLAQELTQSKSYLEGIIGATVPDFASPYGDYDARVINAIKAAGYASHRTVDEGFNSKDNFDAYRLRVQNVFNTTTAAQVSAWVQQAQADHTWLILLYHRVVDTSKAGTTGYEAPGQYDTSVDLFKQQLDVIKNSGITVKTYHDALADVQAQLNPTPPAAKTGDLTGDGRVDDDDATILFANWGNNPKAGDIDKNGAVDDDDATLLFANWSKQ